MISLRHYSRLFREPGLATMLAASIIARLPIGMASLMLLLFVQERTGSFARAGTVSGLYVLGLAALSPILGRFVDRAGPRRVLHATAASYPALMVSLVLLVEADASFAAVGLCAMAAGAVFPPVTSCVRALLPRLVADDRLVHTAYSVDSIAIELMFIAGPVLVAAFAAAGAVTGAVLLAAACAALGGVLFARTHAMQRWRIEGDRAAHDLLGPLRSGTLRAIYAATFCYSVAFGLFEVAVTAFAGQHGSPAAAGVILALASTGSALGALIYGSRDWQAPAARQFLIALALMAASILLLAPLTHLVVFAAVSLIAGAPMATVIAAQSVLISRLAPRAMLAESFTWGATCLLAGVGAGIAAGGLLVEAWSPGAGFAFAACATAAAAAVVGVGLAPAGGAPAGR